MLRSLLCFPFLLMGIFSFSQTEVTVPEEAKKFILPGYEPLDYIIGDLNNDQKPDAILLLTKKKDDSGKNYEPLRPFLLLIRQPNNKLVQALRNDHAIMCEFCGGIVADPYAG